MPSAVLSSLMSIHVPMQPTRSTDRQEVSKPEGGAGIRIGKEDDAAHKGSQIHERCKHRSKHLPPVCGGLHKAQVEQLQGCHGDQGDHLLEVQDVRLPLSRYHNLV